MRKNKTGRVDKFIKALILFIIAGLAINSGNVQAKVRVVNIDSINSTTLKKIEEWIDKDTLVFIEIDGTLMIPKSRMFSYNSNPYRLFIENLISLGHRMPTYNVSVAKWYQQRQVKLVEDEWVNFINRVQVKGAPIYGVCSMPINLSDIEEKRYIEAKNLNLNFTASVNNEIDLIIKRMEAWPSRFYKGIIFTGSYSKSHTLLEFLRITNNVPPKMLIIASIKHEIEAIEESLRAFNMDYKVVLYSGAKEAIDKPDKDIVNFQQQELIQRGIWLEDAAAEVMLKSLKQEQNLR